MRGHSKDYKKKVLTWLKQNKKEFYKNLWKYAGRNLVLTDKQDYIPGMVRWRINEFMGDYQKAGQFVQVGVALLHTPHFPYKVMIDFELIEIAHSKYYERWCSFYGPMKYKQGKYMPHSNYTQMVGEFLARGFVHEKDFKPQEGKPYIIKCNIAPLVYPLAFSQHGEAINQGVGIPGFTSAPIPK